MKVAVVMFPGSSGADDIVYIYKKLFDADSYIVWHQEESIGKPDILVIPGGAAFGDYLRPGALTLSSPIVGPIRKFSRDGGPTLGIGNGFQILCELQILPGILLPNIGMQFLNRDVFLYVQNNQTPFTKSYKEEDVIKLPMACNYGRYFADKRTIRDLEENGEVVFRFCDKEGEIDDKEPFNASLNSIAAICSRHKNTVGMICHPERACEEIMQNTEGRKILGIF